MIAASHLAWIAVLAPAAGLILAALGRHFAVAQQAADEGEGGRG